MGIWIYIGVYTILVADLGTVVGLIVKQFVP